MDDAEKLAAFMQRHSFATLVTDDGTTPFASHLPMLLRRDAGGGGTLVSHMARANPQWEHFGSGREALVIFQGPHSYISPSWYASELVVPTWNYAVAHAYGVPEIIADPARVISLIEETVSFYESSFEQPWLGALPEDFRDRLLKGIVAFQIPLARVEGKFKLGQNRLPADREKMLGILSASRREETQELARMMAEAFSALER